MFKGGEGRVIWRGEGLYLGIQRGGLEKKEEVGQEERGGVR